MRPPRSWTRCFRHLDGDDDRSDGPYVTRNAAALASVALLLVVALVVVQAATAALRREPAGAGSGGH
ncbi:MAG: hypothetical protein WAR57_12225, partial [Candidatus Phosphoribacter sp.]